MRIERIAARVGAGELAPLVAAADVVLDCCDNFATRHAVNAACVRAGKPLVSGAALRFDGQVAVFDARDAKSPCYHCLFGEGDELEETRCATMGVFAPLVGIVGATQAAEALKLLAGVGQSLAGRLLLVDALDDAMARADGAARSRVPGVRARMAAHARCRARARRFARAASLVAVLPVAPPASPPAGRRADAAGRRSGPRSAR